MSLRAHLRRLRDPRTLRHCLGLLAFAVAYVALLWGIELGELYAFGDFSPYFGDRAFGKFVETWHDQQLGYAYIYNVLPAYMGAVTAVGGALGQNLFYLTLIPCGFLAFLVFSGRFVERLDARYLAAGIYAVNPITVGEFANGGLSALIGFAGLPLVLHYLYKITETEDWADSLKAGTVFGATTVVPWLGFWMVGPFAAFLAYRTWRAPRTLAKLVAAGAIGILLSLPNVHHVLQRAGNFDTGKTLLYETLKWNYAAADPLAVVRLAGNRGVRAMSQLGYNDDPAMVVGLAIPGIALLAWRRTELRPFYAVAGGVVAFVSLTGAGLTYPLFDAIPLLWSVRNPIKLQYPLLLALAVLFGAGLEVALGRTPGPAVRRDSLLSEGRLGGDGTGPPIANVVLVAVVTLSLVSYAAPTAGALGMEEIRGDDYSVPEEYETITDRLEGKALWVPYGYTTQLRLRHAYPNHVGIKSGGVLHGIENVEYVRELFSDLGEGKEVRQRLAALGVKYVVVDADAPARYDAGKPRLVEKWGAPWLWGNTSKFETRLNESVSFSFRERVDGYAVYQVQGVEVEGRTSQTEGVHAVSAPQKATVSTVGENVVSNPSFEQNFTDWWAPKKDGATSFKVVETDSGPAAELTTGEDEQALPIAQKTASGVRERHPYRVRVNATGDGQVLLYWYDNESAKSPTAVDSVPLNASKQVVTARGSVLSIRVKPADERVVVADVGVRRTTYPPETEFPAAAARVPGIAVNASEAPDVATNVSVNLDSASETNATDATNASVRLVDAETVLGGELVFDDSLRQGVGVRVPKERADDVVPENATVYSEPDGESVVIDYWVVGAFDDSSVTVLHTSYDERWKGPPDADHFRAAGWANGFTNADADEIRWTGGGSRLPVVKFWLLSWLFVGVALVGIRLRVVARVNRRLGSLTSSGSASSVDADPLAERDTSTDGDD
ncbi:hypothetical protein [Halorussus halophilus]|uniref:hypothetical protein n=1 Tax=Halorussus halophilus TaxID=2650975 RepID=UPI0013014837|nr:hypothetical protein [Halorussus halophilus]